MQEKMARSFFGSTIVDGPAFQPASSRRDARMGSEARTFRMLPAGENGSFRQQERKEFLGLPSQNLERLLRTVRKKQLSLEKDFSSAGISILSFWPRTCKAGTFPVR